MNETDKFENFLMVGKNMARGIIIFGSAGSGKTTLGKKVGDKLGFPYYDIDDYIWSMRIAICFYPILCKNFY